MASILTTWAMRPLPASSRTLTARRPSSVGRSQLSANLAARVLQRVDVDVGAPALDSRQQFRGRREGPFGEGPVRPARPKLRWRARRIQPLPDRTRDAARCDVNVGHGDVPDIGDDQLETDGAIG